VYGNVNLDTWPLTHRYTATCTGIHGLWHIVMKNRENPGEFVVIYILGIGDLSSELGTNRLIRDQRYRTDHDVGMPMLD
jgi:hypothetical protein